MNSKYKINFLQKFVVEYVENLCKIKIVKNPFYDNIKIIIGRNFFRKEKKKYHQKEKKLHNNL